MACITYRSHNELWHRPIVIDQTLACRKPLFNVRVNQHMLYHHWFACAPEEMKALLVKAERSSTAPESTVAPADKVAYKSI